MLSRELNTEEKRTNIASMVEAGNLHDAVNQKYDGQSYSVHLNAVAQRTRSFLEKISDVIEPNRFCAIMFGAYFHDSIEDARQTYNDVMKTAKEILQDEDCAYLATEIVYALTNEKGRNRAERASDKYYAGIRNTAYASIVKFADRMANTAHSKESGSSMNEKYIKEMEHFCKSISNDKWEFGFDAETFTGTIKDIKGKFTIVVNL